MSGRVTRSKGQQQAARQRAEEPRVRWDNDLTMALAELMVEQVRMGNRADSSFSKKAWKSISEGFHHRTGLRWDMEKLKNRYAVLRRQHAIVKSLLRHDAFRFDAATGFVIGGNAAWAGVIEGYPDAEAIKSGGCPFYKQLQVIFAAPESNAMDYEAAEEEPEPELPSAEAETPRSSTVEVETPLFTPSKVPLSAIKEEPLVSASEDIAGGTFLSVPGTTISNRKRGRKGVDDAIAEAILQMAAAAKLKTAILTRIDARYSIADCIKELDKIEGEKGDFYFAALDLFNKPTAREIFLSLKGEKRLAWLQNKCAPQTIT